MTTVVFFAVDNAQADDNAEARGLFEEGISHFNAGEFEKALDAFREANSLNPAWKVLYNIGQSAAAAKRYGLAYESFELYLVKGGDDIPDARRTEVLAETDRLFRMIGSFDVVAPSDSEVFIDGDSRGMTPLPGTLKVAAGVPHQIKIVKGDKLLLEVTRKVSRGETVQIEPTDDALSPADPSPSNGPDSTLEPAPTGKDTRSKSRSPTLKIAGWTAFGIGAAALVGGSITGAMALSLNSDLNNDCVDGHCSTDLESDTERLPRLSAASTALLAAGGTVAVAGITMLFISLKKKSGDSPEAVSILPLLDTDTQGMVVKVGF